MRTHWKGEKMNTKFILFVTILFCLIFNLNLYADNNNINVKFVVVGDTLHEEGEHKDFVLWLNENVSVGLGSTVYDVFKKVMDKNGYTYTGEEQGYIESITSPSGVKLASFTNGSNSGWMYRVNGDDAMVGFKDYVIKDNDEILFYYIDDWREEWGICGDADGNGVIELNDASIVLQYVLNGTEKIKLNFSDINRDGVITALDASLILIKILNS